jgi:antitoxin (DNA-binding transcriptional repressor) of toxin-antitoxin stability system
LIETAHVTEAAAEDSAQSWPCLTWPYGHGHNHGVRTMAAGKFKDTCLQTLDDVAAQRRPVVITKRGVPVAKLVPVTAVTRQRSLVGSIIAESGDPYRTGESWDADRS